MPGSTWADGKLTEVAEQLGKIVDWNIIDQSQPNQTFRGYGPPCIDPSCVFKPQFSPNLLGGTNNNVVGSGVVISVRLIHVHESFDPQTFENDIAVLALENVVL